MPPSGKTQRRRPSPAAALPLPPARKQRESTAPVAEQPAVGSQSVPANAFEAELHPGDDHCAYHAIRSGLIAVGVTPVPAHYLGMRKVVYDACFKKEARGYRMHDERAGRMLVEALCQDKKTLHDLATRTTMTGRRGWAGIEEITVLANWFKVKILIFKKTGAHYELQGQAEPLGTLMPRPVPALAPCQPVTRWSLVAA